MVDPNELKSLISDKLGDFYRARIEKLSRLKLKQILKRKNPYLYRAVGMQNSNEIISEILSAYITSSDETIFGNIFFEPIAVFVSKGKISDGEGIDLTIEKDDKISAYSIKSGPNPFNSSQKSKQNQQFHSLRSRLMKLKKQFDAVLAHCYGNASSMPNENKIYRDVSGQAFWFELTGDLDFYKKLIRHMESEVIDKHKHEYKIEWDKAINRYNREFLNEFCKPNGEIDWEKLLEYNSRINEGKSRNNK